MQSKLEIAKWIIKVDRWEDNTPVYQCLTNAGTCNKCPFNVVNSNSSNCITCAGEYLEQHEKKLQQWKNINDK